MGKEHSRLREGHAKTSRNSKEASMALRLVWCEKIKTEALAG